MVRVWGSKYDFISLYSRFLAGDFLNAKAPVPLKPPKLSRGGQFALLQDSLKAERNTGDVTIAVINSTDILPCRPNKHFSEANGLGDVKVRFTNVNKN